MRTKSLGNKENLLIFEKVGCLKRHPLVERNKVLSKGESLFAQNNATIITNMYSDLYTSTVYFPFDEPIQKCELSFKKTTGSVVLADWAKSCQHMYVQIQIHAIGTCLYDILYNLDMF